jgi:hypothetical protein
MPINLGQAENSYNQHLQFLGNVGMFEWLPHLYFNIVILEYVLIEMCFRKAAYRYSYWNIQTKTVHSETLSFSGLMWGGLVLSPC